ncbi:hypothetical protein ETD83_38495, partial [Actinomadura soli]
MASRLRIRITTALAAGTAAGASSQVAVEVDAYSGSADPDRTGLALLRDAIARGRRVHLSYYV